MKIHKGRNRFTVITCGLVFKFPYFKFIPYFLLEVLNGFKGKKSTPNARSFCLTFVRGIYENMSEFFTFVYCKSPFLVPVFSLGFVNISRFCEGTKPEWKEVGAVLKRLPQDAYKKVFFLDPHHLEERNWIKTPTRLLLCDYGSNFGEHYSFGSFLTDHYDELEKATLLEPPV